MTEEQKDVLRAAFQYRYADEIREINERHKEDYYLIRSPFSVVPDYWTVHRGFILGVNKVRITKEEYEILCQIM